VPVAGCGSALCAVSAFSAGRLLVLLTGLSPVRRNMSGLISEAQGA
jgi:hypothetical protein